MTRSGIAAPDRLRDALLQAYAEPQRAYHTAQHLAECLSLAAQHLALAPDAGQLLFALWFHDAVYAVNRSDNEQRSAAWAREALAEAGALESDQEAVHRLILVTRHHNLARQDDEKLLVDIDLSILGAEPARFEESNRQIRQEYQWVPKPLYVQKRREILESFMARPFIYNTRPFQEDREAQARENLRTAIQALEAGNDGA
ncbi:HD domain-containing protein [Alcanivorax sp. S71-1-4]|uniref:HD domain-containing protein n=1 Tax=Alcanivorax sp. S71-1-4 TaxID=1177159 RepID=UPI001916B60E|nr:N-methyl-D-aspartate receptor NMDAR2C subunit [Alcanivorax sp. S71-1-4]